MTVILRGIWPWRVPPPPPRRGAHNTACYYISTGCTYINIRVERRQEREVKPAARVLLRARFAATSQLTPHIASVLSDNTARCVHTRHGGCPPFVFFSIRFSVFSFSLSPSLSLLSLLPLPPFFFKETAIDSSMSPICNLAHYCCETGAREHLRRALRVRDDASAGSSSFSDAAGAPKENFLSRRRTSRARSLA